MQIFCLIQIPNVYMMFPTPLTINIVDVIQTPFESLCP